MTKPNLHIIYIVEDGIASLTCGVGAIAHNFMTGFDQMVKNFTNQYNIKLSVITIKLSSDFIGIRPDLLKSSRQICQKYQGKIYFIDSLLKPTDNYFNFKIWDKYNQQANQIIERITQSENAKNIVIYNDAIFGHIQAQNCLTIWIPHSLSKNHQRSYADNQQRFKWEQQAIEFINQHDHAYLGYISKNVKDIITRLFNIKENKLLAFKNGFDLAKLKTYKYPKTSVIKMLKRRGIPTDKKIIFSFNRADEYKGLDITLKTMVKLIKKHGEYCGVMVASRFSQEAMVDKTQNQLKKIVKPVKDKINLFLGYEFELPKYLLQHTNTKILLNLPTRDFCPLVPFESELISHNDLSIINSKIDCFSKVIKDGYDGFLTAPQVNSAVKMIEKIIALPDKKRRTIIQKGKIRAQKEMDLVKNYTKALKYLLKK